MLGMHHKTIRKFINEGKLRANKVGKQWRISSHDLSLFMEDNDVSVKSKSESDVLDIISACISNDIKLHKQVLEERERDELYRFAYAFKLQ